MKAKLKHYGLISFITVNIYVVFGLLLTFCNRYRFDIFDFTAIYLFIQPVLIITAIYFRKKGGEWKVLNYTFIFLHSMAYAYVIIMVVTLLKELSEPYRF